MKITYIGFGDFHRFAGMKQLYHFAQEVCRQGHLAQILFPGCAQTVHAMDEPPLAAIVEMAFDGPRVAASVRRQVQNFSPDILHVWTPRFVPALAGWQLHRLTRAQVILDHEDDEDYHVRYMRHSWTQNWQTGPRRLATPAIVLRNSVTHWLHPIGADGKVTRPAQEMITRHLVTRIAAAHTAISPNLVAWARAQWPGKPVYLLYPGADLQRFSPGSGDRELETELGLIDKKVLVYSGTMSLRIFEWFVDVLTIVREQQPAVKLVMVGEDNFRSQAEQLAHEHGVEDHYALVGQVSYSQVPKYLRLADILVQHPVDQANELRLPAKLPEYLAMGKPVITFADGIGSTLEDGVHVRKLYSDQPAEAAAIVLELLGDPKQCKALGTAARSLASDRFTWSQNGCQLVEIYQEVMHSGRKVPL